jgi:sulfur carrier protein ThiS
MGKVNDKIIILGGLMAITLKLRKKVYHLDDEKISVKDAMRKLDLSLEGFLVVRNDELITEREMLFDGDEVKVIAVISGGCEA